MKIRNIPHNKQGPGQPVPLRRKRGENAEHPVEAVLPEALATELVDDDWPNGRFFSSVNHDLDVMP